MARLVLLFSLLSLGACAGSRPEASPPPVTGAPLVGDEFTIAPGETVTLADGATLRFDEITEDSRCPADVTCVWEGRATIRLTYVNLDGVSETFTISIPGITYTGDFEGVSEERLDRQFVLLALQPYPGLAREARLPTAAVMRIEPGT
jgi:hypothetical protein